MKGVRDDLRAFACQVRSELVIKRQWRACYELNRYKRQKEPTSSSSEMVNEYLKISMVGEGGRKVAFKSRTPGIAEAE